MPSAQRRPRDRKAQIARAASDAFSASGFHSVSMEQIAARVGVSAAALYRHAASKYDLFSEAVLGLGQQFVDATAFADEDGEADPAEMRDRLLTALIDTSISTRNYSGLYRRESRYLVGDDRTVLTDQLKLVNRRLHGPLRQLRPHLTSVQRWTLSAAALSVIGSIADHHAKLGNKQIRALLLTLSRELLGAELPAGSAADTPLLPNTGSGMKYEALLRESLRLFHRYGYHDTSMADIAGAVGIPTSGIYRYFTGKGDILAASFRRAADRVSADLAEALSAETDPGAVLDRLVDAYVARSFEDPELAYLYYTDRGNLPAADARILHNIQRATVEHWAQLVTADRPGIEAAEARFIVHATFELVVDLGRLMGYDNSAESRAWVRALMRVTLFGAGRADNARELSIDGASA